MVGAWTPAAVCVAVILLLGAAAAVWWSVGPGRAEREPHPLLDPEGAARARRRTRLEPWMVAGVALFLAGVVVAPRLLGFTFLFLPLLWGRRRRGPDRDQQDGRERQDPDSRFGD
jgi:hypothetical protein